MKPTPLIRLLLAGAHTTALCGAIACAAQRTWLGNTSGDLGIDANWVGGVKPVTNADGIFFNAPGSAGTDLTQNTNIQFTNAGGAIIFSSTAPSYSISGTGLITVGSGSIVNNSGVLQTINNNLKRNTGNSITIGANGGMLEFNGTYDIAASSLTQLAFGTTIGGVIAFNGGLVNSGSAGTYGLTLPNISSPGSGMVVLGGTNTVLNGAVTLGGNNTLKLVSAGALNSGQVVNLANSANNNLWFASNSAVNAVNLNYTAGNAAQAHNIILGRSTSGAAVTNQEIASLVVGQQQGVNFIKAGNVTSGTPKVTVTGATQIGTTVASGSGRTHVISANDVDVSLGSVSGAGLDDSIFLVLDGNTSGSRVTGAIVNGTTTLSIGKAGSGTWTLAGANTYTGGTVVNAGTLKLDFNSAGAPASDILYNGVADGLVTLGGGRLSIEGKDNAASVQNLGTVAVGGTLPGKISLAAGAGTGTTTLNVTGLTINTGGVLNFELAANTTFDNAAISAAAFLNQGAFYQGGNYARYDTGGAVVEAVNANFSTGASVLATNGGSTSSYFFLDGGQARSTGLSFKGLRIGNTSNSQTWDLGGTSQTFSNSSLIYKGGNDNSYSISNGTLAGGTTNLIFQVVNGATLNIGGDVNMGNGLAASFSKSGEGTLVVNGAKTYTGPTHLMEGIYSIDTIANGSSNSGLGASTNVALSLRFSGGTLRYTGGTATTDRSFTVYGPGATIDASGTGALTWAPASAISFANNNNSNPTVTSTNAAQNQTITFTGTSTHDNTFGSASALISDAAPGRTAVTKSGTGKWILDQANTYTGGTRVDGGTLGITNAGALGTIGAISFGGGTLQYGAGITQDLSHRIQHGTGPVSIDTNGNVVTFQSRLDETNIGGLTKSGAGTLILANSNTYTGATVVNAGTLAINGSTSPGSAVTASNAGTILMGSGTIGGDVTIGAGAVHAPGNSVGRQTIGGNLTYTQDSIFAWELGTVLNDSSTGKRGIDYDAVNVSGTLTTTGTKAIFRVVLGDATDFEGAFWDSDHTWTDIFKTSDSGSAVSFASMFSAGAIEYWNSTGEIGNSNGTRSFTMSGSTLTWSAVPEPTSALAGLLITAGLLRRRRTRGE